MKPKKIAENSLMGKLLVLLRETWKTSDPCRGDPLEYLKKSKE
jgi:hypothetical protein